MSSDTTVNPVDAELEIEIGADVEDLELIQLEDDSFDADFESADSDSTDSTDDASDGVAFTSLGLPEALTALLAKGGVTTAFPIQAATIPDALAGRHVLGKARTGSGKTLAFGLAMLANLQGKRARKGKPLGLVLVPTRELAMQVSEALRPYGFAVGLDITAVFGGAPMYKQVMSLRRGVEILVATPGRLTDLMEQEECDLSEVRIAVLDEADQMADMGFMPIVSELLSQTDPKGQRLLFSATLDGAVDVLVKKYLTDPVTHSVTEEDETPTRMDHHLLVVEPNDKSLITAEIAARHTPGEDDKKRTILFARTKLGADRIAEKIREAGVAAVALHGGMTQRARTKTLDDFKLGRVPVLVATDVAARGIHVDGVDLVLHVDPANDPKDYLHRAGRTARAGEAGTVVTLVLPKQRKATLRLLEQAGVEAELTKVLPSSDVLRTLTGGRPVAEYKIEADAYHAARRAARDERGGSQREERGGYRGDREGRGGSDRGGYRGGAGFGGDRRSSGDRDGGFRGGSDRGGYRGAGGGDRPSYGGSRDAAGGERGGYRGAGGGSRDAAGGERGGYRGAGAGGERSSFQERDRRSFSDRDGATRGGSGGFRGADSTERPSSGGERGGYRGAGAGSDRPSYGGSRDAASGDRPSYGSSRDAAGGERRSFGGDRDNRGGYRGGSSERPSSSGTRDSAGGYRGTGDRPSYGGDRTGRPSYGEARGGGERRSFGDRDNRGGSRSAGTGDRPARPSFGESRGAGGERRSFGGDRDSRGSFGGERRSFGDRDNRGTTGGRSFGDRDNRGGDRPARPSYGDRDRNSGSTSSGSSSFSRNGGERRGFGGGNRDARPPRDRRW